MTPTRTRQPRARLLNVNLPRRMVEPEEASGKDGHDILLVVDMRDGDRRVRVDVVREVLVPDARQAVPHETGRNVGDVQREVYCVEKADSCAYGIRA